jgi:hypothetical protein
MYHYDSKKLPVHETGKKQHTEKKLNGKLEASILHIYRTCVVENELQRSDTL